MAIKSTIEGKRVLTKLYRVLVTPYVNGVKGPDTYALDNIVADSTSITQDDADRQEIECETRDENIYEAITLGKYQFTCDNADWQDDLLRNVLGWTVDSTNKLVVAPTSYRELYAEIELQFDDPTLYAEADGKSTGAYRGSLVLPKVLLATKATLESLKTSTGNMTVAGTAYTGIVYKVAYTPASGETPATFTPSDSGNRAPIYFSEKPINVANA